LVELEPTISPSKNKPCTHQIIKVMEGDDEDMEVDVTTQQDDESIRMKTN
jgi:hypothetical protein